MTDITVKGEIDDSISMYAYRQMELLGCVKIIGVVSIFGNGKSSTAEIHRNLQQRLPALGCAEWLRLRGPDERYTTVLNKRAQTAADAQRLRAIAALIRSTGEPVIIAELGPVTVSARLLAGGYVEQSEIARILSVGERMYNENFTTGRALGHVFAFRDMNVAEDVWAQDYLVHHVPSKLWMVTYRTGIKNREVTERAVADAIPVLAEHARARARTLRMIGFNNIPTWDTWTSSYFLNGGERKLGCHHVRAKLIHTARGRDPMRLVLGRGGAMITACTAATN
ncbi:hypothetical protein OEG84_09670 [Hoeflea sp. G2-23]|uniref:Uncharacterized protein n=1 Tax=Hoeflea algicola TaxID=2983763 RepID=A0ABT3Z866_9HYPH|nr:hypothetical protein [Hoeflea algicola]MCY0147969.1 hypothetical protein [Hoeflea algicola]